jgi:6-phosphogluconolactonase (cycloisomerase 2 family)
MKTYLIDLKETVPCLVRGNPAQEHAPLAGHQKSRTPPAASLLHPKQIWPWPIGHRNGGIRRGWLNVWSALAITFVATSSHAQFVYVANSGDGTVSGYTVDSNTGALAPINGSPFTSGSGQSSAPVSVAVDPSGKFAYVANEFDGTVSGYTIDPTTGALNAIGSVMAGTDPIFVAVDPSGKFAYVANLGDGTISGYAINQSSGVLTAISLPVTAGKFPNSVAVDPSGKFAYVANEGDGTVSGYTIDPTTGALAAMGSFMAGTNPASVAVDPSGKFAYVANLGDVGTSSGGSVSGYTIDPTTGALTAIGPFMAGIKPVSVAVDPSGKFAYVANFVSDPMSVSGFTINHASGVLTPITGSPFAGGAEPASVAVDPTGKFAYVANFNSAPSTVSGFTIDQVSGALTPVTNSPFPAGFAPVSVAVAVATPLFPFASSSAKLEISARPPSSFDLNESFTLGKNSNGINPVTENVTLKIGSFSVTIPAGSFTKNPNGRFAFQGAINGVSLQVQIVPLGNNSFTFKAEGAGANLTGLTNPVTVVLTIGNDSGSTTTTAQFH